MNYIAKISLLSLLFIQAAILAYSDDDFSKIKIVSATYGSGQKQADVKEKITDLLVTHPAVVRVSRTVWASIQRRAGIRNCASPISTMARSARCTGVRTRALPPSRSARRRPRQPCHRSAGAIAPASAPVAAASPAPAAPADPGVLEVLSQNSLEATEWILSPLDQVVPQAIRRNLTALREDLLDEGKKHPKAGPEAYRAGYQLCNAMISVLDEREQTRVRAGYRATEAITITLATNQALEARRNYKMRWPQYKREQAQREEVKRVVEGNDNKHLQLAIERIKIDWSDRTAKLHQNLDALYAHFRESIRQEPVTAKAPNRARLRLSSATIRVFEAATP